MRAFLRNLVDRLLGPYLGPDSRVQLDEIGGVSKGVQILLMLKYREMLAEGRPLPSFADVEFRVYSEGTEDGILLFIFSLIGTTNRKVVEIAAGNGIECNAANLILNHGWQALLVDGEARSVETGKLFYSRNRDTCLAPPTLVQSWVTVDNVDALIAEHGFAGEIDLLSLDIDGMDYWIWKAIDAISPRVVVLEYHEEYGYEPVTVPYEPGFDRRKVDLDYYGASLAAFQKLAREKGYRLVGCHGRKYNAFFVRDDVAPDVLPEVPLSSCLQHDDPEAYTLLKTLERFPFERV
jgi:hypothetical protein